MAFRDLREFITLLEQRGELTRIRSQVSPELQITEITDHMSKGPAEQKSSVIRKRRGQHDAGAHQCLWPGAADGMGAGRGRPERVEPQARRRAGRCAGGDADQFARWPRPDGPGEPLAAG